MPRRLCTYYLSCTSTPDPSIKLHDRKSPRGFYRKRSGCYHPNTSSNLFLRLGLGVLQDYSKLRADTQAKNIAAWTPVVAEIVQGFCKLDERAVRVSPLFQFHQLTSPRLVFTIPARDIPCCCRTSRSRHITGSSGGSPRLFRSSRSFLQDH